jgi:hypothetical protein
MGNSNSGTAVPNVRERHSKAIYINIPVPREQVAHLVLPPCEPEEYNGSCWVSIVVDDLDILESWVHSRFINTGMNGWMCKLNLLVKCPCEGSAEYISAYQILTLDFENNWGGNVKVWGARYTQGIPSEVASFRSSFGSSGSAHAATMEHGDLFNIEMMNSRRDKTISLSGTLSREVTTELLSFAKFVVDRPHKILAFERTKLAYSPESGHGSEVPLDGLASIAIEQIDLVNMLERASIGMDSIDLSKIISFVQPYYIIVDHKNVFLPPGATGISSNSSQ